MSKFLELVEGSFNESHFNKQTSQNPYVAYSIQDDRVIYSIVPEEEGYTVITLKKVDISNISYEEVDLGYGLPIWANKNIGAASTEDYGTYFSWGNTKGYTAKTTFLTVEETCSMFNNLYGTEVTTKEQLEASLAESGMTTESIGICEEYSFDDNSYSTTTGKSLTSNITSENDAATVNMGENWRMPSNAEYRALVNTVKKDASSDGLTCKYIYLDKEGNRQELIVYRGDNANYISVSLTDYSKILGIEFSNDQTGASLYFPASDFVNGPVLRAIDINGYYWSSSIDDVSYSRSFSFIPSRINANNFNNRYYGKCVRGVRA